MNLRKQESFDFTRALSWACALAVLLAVFSATRFCLHHYPVPSLLGFTGFKYASMFYVAGRLIEAIWVRISKAAMRRLGGPIPNEDSNAMHANPRSGGQPSMLSARKSSLRSHMSEVRKSRAVCADEGMVARG